MQAVASYLVSAMTELQEIDLHVLSFGLGFEDVTVTKEQNFTRYSLPFSKFGILTAFARDQAVLNKCLANIRPDIVHSQGGGHHGIVAIRSAYPTVVTVHGILAKEANFFLGSGGACALEFRDGWRTTFVSGELCILF